MMHFLIRSTKSNRTIRPSDKTHATFFAVGCIRIRILLNAIKIYQPVVKLDLKQFYQLLMHYQNH